MSIQADPSPQEIPPSGPLSRWLMIAGRLLWLELIGAYALLSLYVLVRRLEGIQGGNPGADFIIYYAASLLTLAGDPSAIFSWPELRQAQASVISGPVDYLPWLYPPPLLLAAAPLASLPYIPAFFVWVLGQLALLAAAVRGLGRAPLAILAAFVFPATVNNILAGQNGALSAAILGGGLSIQQRHPIAAGLVFGLLVYKPHLAIMLPFALLAMGAWRTIAAALASAASISVLSIAVFGSKPWAEFFTVMAAGSNALESGSAHWPKMATVFAALRLAGAEVPIAYAGQALSSFLAILAVIFLWRRGASVPLRASALIFATFLATPYAFFYDLVVLIFAILWLGRAQDGVAPGAGGRAMLALLWLAPIALWLLARYSQISLWPLLLAACLLWVLQKAREERYSPPQA